jgi:hypothetical protein
MRLSKCWAFDSVAALSDGSIAGRCTKNEPNSQGNFVFVLHFRWADAGGSGHN